MEHIAVFNTALAFLNSYRWLAYVAGIIGIVMLIWFGVVSPYNRWVTDEKVAAALKKERTKTQPIIDELAMRVANADKTINDYKAASDNLKAKIESKQEVLNATLKKLNKSTAELAVLRGSDADFSKLLDSATANIGSAPNASAVARLGQLASAHHQCQAEFREERTRHAKTIAGLEQALAVIDAFKP